MQILINDNKEITNYAFVGEFENGINVDEFPSDFREMFKPRLYKYIDEKILLNEDYQKEEDKQEQPLAETIAGDDKELRKLFANMQVQLVQANLAVAQLTQQNANLAQQLTQTAQEIETIKEELANENVIPKI